MNDQEIKNIITFLLTLASQVETIVAKGKISLFEIPGFYSAFEAAGPALSNLKDLPAEIKGINPQVLADLTSYIQSNLGTVANPAVQALIQEGLTLGQQLFTFLEAVQQVKNPAQPGPAPTTPPATPTAA